MKKKKSWPFFVVAILILAAAYLTFFGVYVSNGETTTTYIKGASEIRWGIDIRGGVDATFMPADGYDATEEPQAFNLKHLGGRGTWISVSSRLAQSTE